MATTRAPGGAPGSPSTATPSPVPTLSTAPESPAPATDARPATGFPVPPERDLYAVASELLALDGPIERVVNPAPVSYQQGSRETFWLFDIINLEKYRSEFELTLVTPHAYWYVEEGQEIEPDDLEHAAAIFEETIYPRVTGVFGQEWLPGVDNDPHLNIFHAKLNGVGGYYSSSDEFPREIHPASNEREVIYINTGSIPVDSAVYLDVLAHELQHAVHWRADPTEETWVNEGLAELAATVAGRRATSISARRFLAAAPTSLVHWPTEPGAGATSYGAAFLFMRYLTEHYGNLEDLRPLLQLQADGIESIDAYLESLGRSGGFAGVFANWGVANLINEEAGPHGYSGLNVSARIHERMYLDDAPLERRLPQFATEYVELRGLEGKVKVRFDGADTVDLLPVAVGPDGCWWSNSGDAINSTLTARLDLREASEATLNYEIWHSIEKDWDYGYLEVSTNGGSAWTILDTPNTSAENPLDTAFGPGYTGESDGWIRESVSLDAYAGQDVLLRFQYLSDDALNGHGLCLRQLEMRVHPPGSNSGPDSGKFAWKPDGFVWSNNLVKQSFIVQIVRQQAAGSQVTRLDLDDRNNGELIIEDTQDSGRVVAVVQATAPGTKLPAAYTLSLEQVN